ICVSKTEYTSWGTEYTSKEDQIQHPFNLCIKLKPNVFFIFKLSNLLVFVFIFMGKIDFLKQITQNLANIVSTQTNTFHLSNISSLFFLRV
ncbi:hypothetical protein VIGAN_07150400, partial [Vigna angularis var. angularis]